MEIYRRSPRVNLSCFRQFEELGILWFEVHGLCLFNTCWQTVTVQTSDALLVNESMPGREEGQNGWREFPFPPPPPLSLSLSFSWKFIFLPENPRSRADWSWCCRHHRPFSQLRTWPRKKSRERQCRAKDLARTANLQSFRMEKQEMASLSTSFFRL